MTTATKRWIVRAILTAALLWPLVHLALVARYDLNRWKLAGWGMYTEPGLKDVGMEVYGRRTPNGTPEVLTQIDATLRQEADEFLYDYRWLRRLTQPDSFVGAIAATHPDWQRIEVHVFRPYLVPQSGFIERSHVRYTYDRAGDGTRVTAVEEVR